jgi:hypothetical protein
MNNTGHTKLVVPEIENGNVAALARVRVLDLVRPKSWRLRRQHWNRRIPRSVILVALMALGIVGSVSPPADALQFAVMQNNRIRIDPDQIVSWIFNNQRSVDQVHRELEEILQTRVDLIAQACELTPEQQEKLSLAGAGDIHRFFNEFQTLKRSLPTGSVTQEEYQQMWQKIQPIRQKYNAGIFDRDSLLTKTVRYVLQENQISRYEEFERKRRQRYFESVVRATIAMMEDELPLTSGQRERLLKLVLAQKAEIRVQQSSYYQMYAVLYQISKIPEEELKPIFLSNEWVVMKALLNRGRQYEVMLRQEGLID